MRPFETLDSVTTPEGRELSLHHHDGHYFIHLDGEELMQVLEDDPALGFIVMRRIAEVLSSRARNTRHALLKTL